MFKYKLKHFSKYASAICLDKRKTVWSKIEGIFSDHGVLVDTYEVGLSGKFFQDNPNAHQTYNYCSAVQKLMSQIDFRTNKYHLYIEDDIFRHEWFNTVFDNAICQLNKKNLSFDVLYLCCDRRSKGYSVIDRNLLRVHHVDGLCGLLFNEKFKEEVMKLNPSNIGIDGMISSLGIQRRLECYSVYPNIVDQLPGFSYNSNKTEDLTYWTWL